MRTGYGIAKGFSIGLLALTLALRSAGHAAAQPVWVAGLVLAWISLAICVLRGLPVIMVTALNDIQSAVKCIEFGAEDYLIKPFNSVLLKARVRACLEKKRLQDIEARETVKESA